ncbi:CD63 antigen-like isoform X2 [Leptopilina boulardi]|uniref:CD63 antigen-like isoform X2 n=1 Tax=Leptopilina boulardi TaxID=63433 RepID=UPI0021F57B6F|nr:CD63 antigen-like isoform X2 [Leptopilina boulardi]
MNCVFSFIKYFLFFLNAFFAICGLALLTVGVIFYIKIHDVSSAMGEGFPPSVPIFLIVLGAIIFIIAFFGCCGAIRDSHCMVVTFAVFLLTILVIQVAIAVYVYIQKVDETKIESAFKTQIFDKYYKETEAKDIVDAIQSSLNCCGIRSSSDYSGLGPIPGTCCGNAPSATCTGSNNIYREGCGTKISDLFKTALKTLGGVAVGVAIVELLGIIFSLCLANAIRNDERRAYRV